MTNPIDLNPNHLATVQRILAEHVPACEVRAYGSRATWTAKDYSDLDLAVVGDGPLDRITIGCLKEAFEESDLPMRVDVLDWHAIPESFREVIEQDYVVVQEAGDKHTAAAEWREGTWGEIATLEYGKSLRGYKSSEGPYRVYGTNGPIGWHTEMLCPHPSVIIGRKGAYRGVHYSSTPFFAIDTAFYLKPKTEIDARWAYYQLLTQDINGMDSGSAIPSTSRNDFYSLSVKVPPLPEQRAIAHILGTLDDKIELNRRMNETLEEMARALFKSWFVDFDPVRAKMDGRWRPGESLPGLPAEHYDLFPDRLVPSELGEIPEGWEVKVLGEVVELAYGKALRATDRKGGPIPVYGSNGQVGWHDEKLADGPGIVVGRKGNPGVVTWTHSDFFPIDTTFYVVPRGSTGGLPFLFFALVSQNLPSVSADTAVPGLNRNLAYMNEQLVPDHLVVNEFNHYVGTVFTRHHQLEEESRTLATQRDALLPQLVSGVIRMGSYRVKLQDAI